MIYFQKPTGAKADFRAVGCFMESGGRILQMLRAKNKKIEPSKWGAPAGTVIPAEPGEIGETPEAAMVREIFEETGIRIFAGQLKKIGEVFVTYPDTCFDYIMFSLIFPFRPEINLSREHSAYVWIKPADACSIDLMQDEWDAIKLAYCLI